MHEDLYVCGMRIYLNTARLQSDLDAQAGTVKMLCGNHDPEDDF